MRNSIETFIIVVIIVGLVIYAMSLSLIKIRLLESGVDGRSNEGER